MIRIRRLTQADADEEETSACMAVYNALSVALPKAATPAAKAGPKDA
jgi:hypothetical protein